MPRLFILLAFLLANPAIGQYAWDRDVAYVEGIGADDRRHLDVYHPEDADGFLTVVWLHPGGMTSGRRYVPVRLREQGMAVVAVGYRLNPDVRAPAYIEDAAAAVAWTVRNIDRYGGDPDRVVVAGFSAGAYLAMMVGLDPRWLDAHNLGPHDLAAIGAISGHTITHFTVRAERGIPGVQPVIDDLAPLYHVGNDAPPLLLVTGDRDLEMLARYEENALLHRLMAITGHRRTELYELEGFDHSGVERPALELMLRFLERIDGD